MLRNCVAALTLGFAALGSTQALVPDWTRVFGTPTVGSSTASALVPDRLGGAYLLSSDSTSTNGFTTRSLVIRRLDSFGSTLWKKVYGDMAAIGERIGVDPAGNITVLSAKTVAQTTVSTLLSLTPDGNQRFLSHQLEPFGIEFGNGLGADSTGRVAYAFVSGNRWTLTVLGPTGVRISRREIVYTRGNRKTTAPIAEAGGTFLTLVPRADGAEAQLVRVSAATGLVARTANIAEVGQDFRLAVDGSGRVTVGHTRSNRASVTEFSSLLTQVRLSIVGLTGSRVGPMAVFPNGTIVLATAGGTQLLVRVIPGQPVRNFTPQSPQAYDAIGIDASRGSASFVGTHYLPMSVASWFPLATVQPVSTGGAPRSKHSVAFSVGTVGVLAPNLDQTWRVDGFSIPRNRRMFRLRYDPVPVSSIVARASARAANGTVAVAFERRTATVITQACVIAYGANGGVRWMRPLEYIAPNGQAGRAEVVDLIAHGDNFVASVRYVDGLGITLYGIAGADGQVLWSRSFPLARHPMSSGPNLTAVGADVAAVLNQESVALLVRLNASTGEWVWSRTRYENESDLTEPAGAVALPGGGLAFGVRWTSHPGVPSGFQLFGFNAAGVQTWTQTVSTLAGAFMADWAPMRILPNGQIVMLLLPPRTGARSEYQLIWLSSANGQIVRTVPLGVFGQLQSSALEVDPSGNVTVSVSGFAAGTGTTPRTRVRSFVGATGVQRYSVDVAGPLSTTLWQTKGLAAGLNGTAIAQFERFELDPLSPNFGKSLVLLRLSATGTVTGSGVWGPRDPGGQLYGINVHRLTDNSMVSVAQMETIPAGVELRLQRFLQP